MSEPGAGPVEVEGDGPTDVTRRSQRPHKPLTHRMDLRAVRQAYFEAGLLQPELERQKLLRPDRAITRTQQTSALNIESRESELMQTETTESTSTKPDVGGTQQHTSRVITELPYGQKCLMNGGTAVVSGAILMLAWKGLTRWIG
jgi:hypothetical protein